MTWSSQHASTGSGCRHLPYRNSRPCRYLTATWGPVALRRGSEGPSGLRPWSTAAEQGSASLPQPRTLRTKMSGKSRFGFGTGRRLQVGWSVLSPQPDSSVWAAWYLCSGNGTRQASFLSLPSSYSPRARQKAAPLHIFSYVVQVGTCPGHYPPDLVPAGQPPGVIPAKVTRSAVYVYRNLLGLAQVVPWACKPPSPIMYSVVPCEWDLRTRGDWRRVGSGPPLLCLVPLIFMGPGYWACLPTCQFLASWLTFYPQDSGHSKGGGHSCDTTPGCRVRALGRKKASKVPSPRYPA